MTDETDEPEDDDLEDEPDADEPDSHPVTRRVVIRGGRMVEVTTYPAGMETR